MLWSFLLLSALARGEKAALLIIDVQDCFLPGGSLAVDKADRILSKISEIYEEKDCLFDFVVRSQDFHPERHISFGSTHHLPPFSDLPGPVGLGKGELPLTCVKPSSGQTADASCCPSFYLKPSAFNCSEQLCPGDSASHVYEGKSIITGNPACTLCAQDPSKCFETSQRMWTDHCLQTGDSTFPSALEQLTTDVVVHKGINQFVDAYSAFADNTHNLKTELDNILKQQGITKLYIVGIATDVCVTYTTRDAVLYGYEVVVVGDATAGIFPDTEASALSSFGALPNVTVMDTAEVLEAKCKRRRRRNAGKWGGLQGAKVLDEYAPHWTKWAGSWARKLAPGYTPVVLNEFDHVHFMQHEL